MASATWSPSGRRPTTSRSTKTAAPTRPSSKSSLNSNRSRSSPPPAPGRGARCKVRPSLPSSRLIRATESCSVGALDPLMTRLWPAAATRSSLNARIRSTSAGSPAKAANAPATSAAATCVLLSATERSSHSAICCRCVAVACQRSSAWAPLNVRLASIWMCLVARPPTSSAARWRADQARVFPTGSGPTPNGSAAKLTSTSALNRSSRGASGNPSSVS